MTDKHTNGEWFVDPEPLCGDGLKVMDEQGRAICHTSACRNIRGRIIDNPIEREEAEANAYLIAAGTKMFDALSTLVQCAEWQIREGTDHHPTLPSAIGNARAALAKARREV